MAASTQKTEENQGPTIFVYGLNDRRQARRLIRSLAACGCLVSTVFRVDKFAKLLGGIDGMDGDRMMYIRVHRWSSGDPDVAWTRTPTLYRRTLRKETATALQNHTRASSKPPMRLKFTLEEYARMVRSAS